MSDINNIFWLTGSYHMRRKSLADIKNAIGDYDLSVYDKETPIDNVLSSTSNTGLFVKNHLVILLDIPDATGKGKSKKLKALFEDVGENCFLVFDGVSKTRYKIGYDYVNKHGKIIDFPIHLERDEAVDWVVNRFREKGIDIGYDEVECLLELSGFEYRKGYNVDRLYMCIKNVSDYLGKKTTLSVLDIKCSISRSDQFVIWSFMDALDAKDYSQCIQIVQDSLKFRTVQSVISEIMPILFWRFKALLYLKESIAKKKDYDTIKQDIFDNMHKFIKEGNGVRAIYKLEKDADDKPVQAYSNAFVNSVLNGFYHKPPMVDLYSRKDIYRAIRCIGDCLAQVKKQLTDAELLLLLDNVLLTLLSDIDDHVLEDMRGFDYE